MDELKQDFYPFSFELYFVCFIDILGFSDMVKLDCEGPKENIKFIEKLWRLNESTIELNSSSIEGLRVNQFSDSVVLSAPYKKETKKETFPSFLKVISKYQYGLFRESILCRGGVAYGKHFCNGAFLFSNGLIEAYNLEKSVARYSRIVVSNDLIELLYPSMGLPQDIPLMRENDGALFIDFLSNGSSQDYENLHQIIDCQKVTNISIKEKHRWLTEYFNYKFPNKTYPVTPRFNPLSKKE